MRAAAIRSPTDFEVLGEYGKALADSGPLDQAAKVLANAYTADRPDWTIMSVQGAVADELGDHAGARRFYREALAIAPGEPYVLNNLGLSYMLTKQLSQAEATLREANASPRSDARVRNNLALVLALEGKFAKAQEVSRGEMSLGAAPAAARAHRARPLHGNFVRRSDDGLGRQRRVGRSRTDDNSHGDREPNVNVAVGAFSAHRWPEYWRPISSNYLWVAGAIAAIAASLAIWLLVVQGRNISIREAQAEWRMSMLESRGRRSEEGGHRC